MYYSIAAIASELTRKVPQQLVGTRAAIFYLMRERHIETPTSVHAPIRAVFGRTLRFSGSTAQVISGSELPEKLPSIHLRRLDQQMTQDQFDFQL